MQRVALINGTNKNQDYDLAKAFSSIVNSGVVKGLEVQNGRVISGHAFIDVIRDGISFPILFTNSESVIIDTTGDKKVFIEISQAKIDDGSNNASDGTGIGEIKIANNYPGSNFVKLASITNGVITDERTFINLKDFGQTKQGNTFNGPEQLVQTNKEGQVPPELIGSPIVNKTQSTFIAGEDILKGDALCQLSSLFEYSYSQPEVSGTWGADISAGVQDLYSFTAEYDGEIKSVKIYGLTRGSNTNDVKLLLTDTQNNIIDTSDNFNWNSAIEYRTHTFFGTNNIAKGNIYKVRVQHTYRMDINAISGNNIDFYHESIFAGRDSSGKVYKTDASDVTRLKCRGTAESDALLGEQVNIITTGVDQNQANLEVGANCYLNQNQGPIVIEQTDDSIQATLQGNNQKFGQTFTMEVDGSITNIRILGSFYSGRVVTMKLYKSIGGTLIKEADNTHTGTGGSYKTNRNFGFSGVNLKAGTYYFECTHNSGASWYVYGSDSSKYDGGGFVNNGGSPSSTRDLDFSVTGMDTQRGVGKIGTIPGNNSIKVGTAISETEILIDTFSDSDLSGNSTTSATTGGVVLGNAEGYITIKVNGEDKKIPYYGI